MRAAQAVMIIGAALFAWPAVSATPGAVASLLDDYRRQGAATFSAARGEALWFAGHTGPQGKTRSCATCHTRDPRQRGRHAVTGKSIAPMAPSVNTRRLSTERKIRKWLRRNCKWTLGRECTPQEKGDLLTWLVQQ